MPDGCLSLVTIGRLDQRGRLVNAITFQLQRDGASDVPYDIPSFRKWSQPFQLCI